MRIMMTKPDYAAMAKAMLAKGQDVEVTDAELLRALIDEAEAQGRQVDWRRRQFRPAPGEDPLWHCDIKRATTMLYNGFELRGEPAGDTP